MRRDTFCVLTSFLTIALFSGFSSPLMFQLTTIITNIQNYSDPLQLSIQPVVSSTPSRIFLPCNLFSSDTTVLLLLAQNSPPAYIAQYIRNSPLVHWRNILYTLNGCRCSIMIGTIQFSCPCFFKSKTT